MQNQHGEIFHPQTKWHVFLLKFVDSAHKNTRNRNPNRHIVHSKQLKNHIHQQPEDYLLQYFNINTLSFEWTSFILHNLTTTSQGSASWNSLHLKGIIYLNVTIVMQLNWNRSNCEVHKYSPPIKYILSLYIRVAKWTNYYPYTQSSKWAE